MLDNNRESVLPGTRQSVRMRCNAGQLGFGPGGSRLSRGVRPMLDRDPTVAMTPSITLDSAIAENDAGPISDGRQGRR